MEAVDLNADAIAVFLEVHAELVTERSVHPGDHIALSHILGDLSVCSGENVLKFQHDKYLRNCFGVLLSTIMILSYLVSFVC